VPSGGGRIGWEIPSAIDPLVVAVGWVLVLEAVLIVTGVAARVK
jgi:hypothetical protein